MQITDARMLSLLEILKQHGVIRFDKDFCEAIGLLPQNLTQIKKPASGRPQHFTPNHIQAACEKYGVDANYIFGFTDVPFVKTAVTHGVTFNNNTAVKSA